MRGNLNKALISPLLFLLPLFVVCIAALCGLSFAWIDLVSILLCLAGAVVLKNLRLLLRYATKTLAVSVSTIPDPNPKRPFFACASLALLADLVCAVLIVPLPLAALCCAIVCLLISLATLVLYPHSKKMIATHQKQCWNWIESTPVDFSVFLSYGSFNYNYLVWEKFLLATERSYALLTFKDSIFKSLSKETAQPVICFRNNSDAGLTRYFDLIKGRTVVIITHGQKNQKIFKMPYLHSVFIYHGDSDKQSSASKMAGAYDRIFIAGQAGIDRFAANGVMLPAEKFRIVGRPQAAGILPEKVALPDHKDKPTFLYAPTWHGPAEKYNYSSLHFAPKMAEILVAKGYRVIFRPHPISLSNTNENRYCEQVKAILAADNAAHDSGHLYGEVPERTWGTVECFNHCDTLISDVSSVTSDFLFSRKPIILISRKWNKADFIANFPVARGAYVVEHDLGNLAEAAEHCLTDDPLAAQRAQMRDYYLGDFPDQSYEYNFINALVEEIDRHH
ncbi:MAG: CDP-glycerol glycerophosphotransferase family protein [Coriobacteriales bacterium]|jgi:CDP-glycerol glycerophosphotransferase (TagB/SpsB family)|nr:CDP-glycerol glycerophosphotransferase family protein [Coriobacteriales bacterium]